MKKALITSYWFIMAIMANSQTSFVWAKQMGGSTWPCKSNAVATDANGNVYTTGSYRGTPDFDPGAGTFTLTANGEDAFISKLDASGNFVWAKSLSGTMNESGHAIKTDASGNVYTTGWFVGTVDFDPGPNTYNLTSVISGGGTYNSYVSKLDASGNFVWAKQFSGGGNATLSIALDASGNVYTTGEFAGTTDFDPGASTVNITSAVSIPTGASDVFISKLDAAGNFVYVKQVSGAMGECAYGIFADATGKIYLTGAFAGTVDFDPGSGTSNLAAKDSINIFVLKLDATGNFVWAKSMGGTAAIDYGLAIAADNLGNVFTTGYFTGTTDFDPAAGTYNLISDGLQDIFICKLDASGNFGWARKMGGITNDAGNAITVDASRNVYVTGSFQGIIDFDPATGKAIDTSAGGSDVFIVKYNEFGSMIWAKTFGGWSHEIANGVVVGTTGNVYTTGYFSGTVDFDPGSGVSSMTAYLDVFVHKMSQNNIGIKHEGLTTDFNIYPNPVSGIFNVSLTNNEGNAVIEIFNNMGLLVHRQCAAKYNTIDISNEAAGLYIIKLISGNCIVTSQKIIKE